MNIKKVIVLTLESLRYDRLGMAGHSLNTSPTLDFLAKNGIHCSQAMAHGAATQLSHPSIWTSTLPLDFGGYDRGIAHRSVALPEIFKQNGFETVAFSSSFAFDSYYGYDRGFDESHILYNVRDIWMVLYASYFMYYLSQWQAGHLDEDTFCSTLKLLLERTYETILSFCKYVQVNKDNAQSPYKTLPYRDELQQVEYSITKHLHQLQRNPKQYILANTEKLTTSNLMDFADVPREFPEKLARKIRSKLPNWFDDKHLFTMLMTTSGLLPRRIVPGAFVLDAVEHWLKQHQSDNSFLWVPLDDLHDRFSLSGKLPNPLVWGPILFERAKLGDKYQGGIFYDLSVRYIDNLVARLLRTLKQQGIFDETLIIICADHGMKWAEMMDNPPPNRVRPVDFYEEHVKVPLIFWHSQMKPQQIDHPCGLIDLAPTIVDLMGFKSNSDFKGLPVYAEQAKNRDYLILEDAIPGPCDLANKAIRIAIRTPEYKYIWQEDSTQEAERNELYHLATDPLEVKNLVGLAEYHDLSQELLSIAQERWQSIKPAKVDTI